MNTFFDQVFTIIAAPQGALAYHLVLTFAALAALLVLPFPRRPGKDGDAARLFFGLALLLALQVAHFFAGGLAWAGMLDGKVVLPLADRADGLLSLVVIAWLWAFPSREQLADTAALALCGAAAGFLTFSLFAWTAPQAEAGFNGSILELVWTIPGLIISLAGIAMLAWRRPSGWGAGLAMLLIFAAGYLYQLLAPQPGTDFSVPLRLAFICALPLLPSIARRSPAVEHAAESVYFAPAAPEGLAGSRHPNSIKPVLAWLRVALHTGQPSLPAEIARAIAVTLGAETCQLAAAPTPEGIMHLPAGYDLLRETALPASQIDIGLIPRLSRFLEKGEAVLMSPNNPEHQALVENVGLESCDMLLIPIRSPRQVWGGALLQSPVSGREWEIEDEEYLSAAGETLARLLDNAVHALPEGVPIEQPHPLPSILNQPVHAINGLASLLLSGAAGILSSRQKTHIEKIASSAAGLRDAIDNPGTIEVPVSGDLASALDEAVANDNTRIRRKALTLQVDLPDLLPRLPVDHDILVLILGCVLENTINQAVEKGLVSLRAYPGTGNNAENALIVQVVCAESRAQVEALERFPANPDAAPLPVPQEFSPARLLAEAHGGSLTVGEPMPGTWISTLTLPVRP